MTDPPTRKNRFIPAILIAGILLVGGIGMSLADEQTSYQEPQFFTTLNDVPLMPGLQEITEQAVLFDKPGGRIAESTAATEAHNAEAIRNFYDRTLPQLGWSREGANVFTRQDEQLEVNIEESAGYNIVHITVRPRS